MHGSKAYQLMVEFMGVGSAAYIEKTINDL